MGGAAGGPWRILRNTISTLHGPQFVRFDVELAGARTRVRAGNVLELEMEPIRNPVTKAEVFPRVVLPQGFVYNESTRTSSRAFRIQGPIQYEYAGRDAAFSLFEYTGPEQRGGEQEGAHHERRSAHHGANFDRERVID